MANRTSFKGYTIVSCGTLRRELGYLKDTNFLDADKILFTAPGLHERQTELERQLTRQLKNARRYSPRIIVVYGERCYLDPSNPYRNVDQIIKEEGARISRIQARSCIDMLASEKERERISAGRKIYEFSDWMKLQIEPHGISLERFKNLLLECTRENEN